MVVSPEMNLRNGRKGLWSHLGIKSNSFVSRRKGNNYEISSWILLSYGVAQRRCVFLLVDHELPT